MPLTPLLPRIAHDADLGIPESCILWPLDRPNDSLMPGASRAPDLVTSLARTNALGHWDWPEKPVVFISDLHADAESLLRSLVAARAILRGGDGLTDFSLTPFGRSCQIVIGGDCLDKGPSNLDLLDSLAWLMKSGADVVLLAGNHDLRLYLGLEALTVKRKSVNAHMFVRMGKKVMPLLKEVFERYVDAETAMAGLPDETACLDLMVPGKRWTRQFPRAAAQYMNKAAIDKEMRRLKRKTEKFADHAAESGLSIRQLYAAALKCRELFVEPSGRYAWFFQCMKAVHQSGSLLFVHAGIDDHMAAQISSKGVAHVNRRFRKESRKDPFVFYSGTVANLMRTKYRDVDHPLTETGVEELHLAGIKLLVQGHVNRHNGQELKSKHGLLHLEADITLDRHSRSTEGLEGIGTGATIIYPDGNILGISRDYPHAKLFNPARFLQQHGLSR
ncbi:metallophosphoesterase family protein [Roseibium marinum]|uniref:Calcineurin-like phosphoesterase family protein n=1 Tax=Roseibium marinum TaxID=281252 RepID=A0A2S3UKV1_9HYPH|nr:metallophosphoesterase family protein [Roseibium marinum]POF28352.1 calcineurin-like phosphoesterase family protein [Roseibium marinum]